MRGRICQFLDSVPHMSESDNLNGRILVGAVLSVTTSLFLAFQLWLGAQFIDLKTELSVITTSVRIQSVDHERRILDLEKEIKALAQANRA